MNRRFLFTLPVLVSMLFAISLPLSARADEPLPIVFIHGDSDTAGHWMTQIWRFESNGYPADHLFAVDIPHPSARADNDVPEANRSSAGEAAKAVSKMVDLALTQTGAKKVVLVANSRGCQTARNYVRNRGGVDKVAKMVLTGCVHNGVFVAPGVAEGSEYNGAGHFLKSLNEAPVIPEGVDVTTIRSDKFDLYAQPDGRFIGSPGKPTGVSYDAPELKGADNQVIAGLDHRETGFSSASFAAMYKAIVGKDPATTEILPEKTVTLSGKLSGFENGAPTNMPLTGAELTVYKTDASTGARLGDPVLKQVIGADGAWGPISVPSEQTYEFVIKAEGRPLTRIYRSAFARSSQLVNLRVYPPPSLSANQVHIMRPRGYFGPDDKTDINGAPFPGIPADPVPHVWKSSVTVSGTKTETVKATFGTETIAAMSYPDQGPSVVWIELTY
jgi:triacylglycerol lipase